MEKTMSGIKLLPNDCSMPSILLSCYRPSLI